MITGMQVAVVNHPPIRTVTLIMGGDAAVSLDPAG